MGFFHDLVCIEPAWRENNYLRLVLNNLVPFYSVGRLAETTESFESSSVIDHLRNPVSASPGRLKPFHEEDPRFILYSLRFLSNPVYSPQHLRSKFLSFCQLVCHPANQENIVNDLLQIRRLQRDDLCIRIQYPCCFLDPRIGNGANMAEFLRQNEIRRQLLQKFFVNLVNVAAALFNFPVNLKASVDLLVNRRLGQNGSVRSLRRIIAFVGHGDNLVYKPEGECNLCGAGK